MKWVWIAVVVSFALLSASCAGLDFGDVVQARTPPRLASQLAVKDKMSVNTAATEYRRAIEEEELRRRQVDEQFREWADNIGAGFQIAGAANDATLQAFNQAGPTVAGIPILGPAILSVLGGGGLLGGMRAVHNAKIKSFNKGQQTAGQLAAVGKGAPVVAPT